MSQQRGGRTPQTDTGTAGHRKHRRPQASRVCRTGPLSILGDIHTCLSHGGSLSRGRTDTSAHTLFHGDRLGRLSDSALQSSQRDSYTPQSLCHTPLRSDSCRFVCTPLHRTPPHSPARRLLRSTLWGRNTGQSRCHRSLHAGTDTAGNSPLHTSQQDRPLGSWLRSIRLHSCSGR